MPLLCLFAITVTAQREKKDPAATEATGTQQDPHQVEKLYHEAAIRSAQENYREALELYREVVKLDPDNHAAHYNIGRILLLQEGNPSAALPEALAALTAESPVFWYYELAALVYHALGDLPKATRYLEQGTALFPAFVEARFQLASFYVEDQQFPKALKLYDELELLTGNTEEVAIQRYTIYMRQGDRDKAVAELRRLIQRFPDNRQHYVMLFQTYLLFKQPEEAEAVLDELLALDPGNLFALEQKIDRYLQLGALDQLKAFFEQVLASETISSETKLQLLSLLEDRVNSSEMAALVKEVATFLAQYAPNSPEVVLRRAMQALREDDYNAARKLFLEVLSEDPLAQEAWDGLLTTDDALLRYDWLLSDAFRALEAYPNQPRYNLAYATAARWQEDFATATRYADRYLLLATPTTGESLFAHTLLAEANAGAGDLEAAEENWQHALTLVPDEPETLARYATYLLASGLTEQAEKPLALANRMEPDNPWVAFAVGYQAWLTKGYADAEAAWLLAYEMRPSAWIAEHLGDVFAATDRLEEARRYWQLARDKGGNPDRLDGKLKTP